MKVYLAARWNRGRELREFGRELEQRGIELVSHWVFLESHDGDGFSEVGDLTRQQLAHDTVRNIERANIVVQFLDEGEQGPTCTRYMEAGIALGLQKTLVVVGRPTNLLQFHAGVVRLEDQQELCVWLLDRYSNELLTVEQVARQLKVTRQAVCYWLRRSELPGARKGSRWLVRRDDLEAFNVARCRRQAGSAGAGAQEATA